MNQVYWKKLLLLICGGVLLIGCSKVNEEYQVSEDLSSQVSEEMIQEDLQSNSEEADDSVICMKAGLVSMLEVEAGTEGLTEEDFCKPDCPELLSSDLEILTVLTAEQLSAVGRTYDIEVRCQENIFTIPVHVVDTTPPIIGGFSDLYITLGDSVSYKKNVYVTDNSGEELAVDVDASEVDLGTVGTYTVYYSATDSSGNRAQESVLLVISDIPVIDEAYVGPMADEVIASVITPDMSQWDQAYALFYWVKNNVTYTADAGDMSSIWTGAYDGLHNHHGDCYVFYATYSVLLTRVGIPNMCVERVDGDSEHYWNLVNVGNGWYHCDSSPRNKKHPYICFMQTDAQLAAYMESFPERKNYYKFDESIYPERGTEIVFGE